MNHPPKRGVRALLVSAVGVAAMAFAAPVLGGAGDPGPVAPAYAPAGQESRATAVWTRAEALRIRQGESNTSPIIPPNFPTMTDEVWVWDTWPLTDLQTRSVEYQGWKFAFSLTAPRNIPFSDRHWVAKIGFFYSRDGKSWKYGGPVFPEGTGLGARQWAGSTLLVGNRVYSYYTASGRDGEGANPNSPLQRLAVATGRIEVGPNGPRMVGFNDHRIILEADGRKYQTLEQSLEGPIIYAFRDPFVFRDPQTRRIKMLFEGNSGGAAGSHRCTRRETGGAPLPRGIPTQPVQTAPSASPPSGGPQPTADPRYYTGNIGIADSSGNLTRWRLEQPLLSANCVNQQLERPHIVIRDGKYYLWTISHKFTFAPGLTGPDGLYGWVGDRLRTPRYRPLNGSGLVIGNPPSQPLQQYSHYVMPNFLVESFIDTIPTANGPVFGGTLAPTLLLDVRGRRTSVQAELDYALIP